MSLEVNCINKSFEDVRALVDVDLEVKKGEFFTLLGPSGCGKTTLLRILAGLEMPDSGAVVLDGQHITHLPANRRHVNTVFQSYALFPHLNIFENVAFGLRSRKKAESEVETRVNDALKMLHLTDFSLRMPDQMSGGQRQRVALARALVNEPELLLLDEPMSALDAKLRHDVQEELRSLQVRLGKTFILVTHDQDEALTVSDRIAVMRDGRIIQVDSARQMYERPRTRFVADFLGTANIFEATREGDGLRTRYGMLHCNMPDWQQGWVALRPEGIRLREAMPEKNGARLTVMESFYRGDHLDIHLDPGPLRMRTAPHRGIKTGDEIIVEFLAESMVCLDED